MPDLNVPPPRPRLSKRSISDALESLDSALKPSPLSQSSKRPRTTPTSTRALESLLSLRPSPRSLPSPIPAPSSYTPTSLPSLLSRLSTYRLTTYSPSKPSSLSSLECALHGWNNSGKERLTCVTCDQSILLLPPTSGSWSATTTGKALVTEYENKVIRGKGHRENCPWGLRPCSKSIYKLEGGGLGVSKGGRRRLLELVGEESRGMDETGLGRVELELGEKVKDLLLKDGEKLRKNVTSLLAPTSSEQVVAEPSTTSILLSIFGWTLNPLPTFSTSLPSSNSSSSLSSLSSTSKPPILCCHYCLRQILITPYLPTAASNSPNPPKSLNPLNQHYNYCPYIDTTLDTSPSSTSSSKGTIEIVKKAGWQLRLEAVVGGNSTASYDTKGLMRTTTSGSVGSISGENGVGETRHGKEKSGTVKTRELLSYVRGLLGPKVNRKVQI